MTCLPHCVFSRVTSADFPDSPPPGEGAAPSPQAAEAYRQGHALFIQADRAEGDEARQELYRQAVADFFRALELQPDHKPACNYAAMCLRRLAWMAEGDERTSLYRQAASLYIRAAELQPENGHVLRNWGRTLVDLSGLSDDPAEIAALRAQAVDCFSGAVRLDPQDAVSHSYWGCTLEVLADDGEGSDPPAAVALLRREALEKLEAAVALDPQLADAWYHAGVVLHDLAGMEENDALRAGLDTRACECLVAALALFPRWGNAERTLGQALACRAELTQDADERARLIAEAGVHFAAAVALEPEWHHHLHDWGTALFDLSLATKDAAETQRLMREGIAKFEAVLALAPGFQTGRLGLANALVRLANLTGPEESAGLLERATALFAELESWRPEESVGNFRWAEALRMKAGLTADREERVRLLREAVVKFAAAGEYYPDSFLIHEQWGLTLLQLFRAVPAGPEEGALLKQVREKFLRAHELAPGRADPLIFVAGSYEEESRRGADKAEAVRLLKKAARYRVLAAEIRPDEPSNLLLWTHNLLARANLANEAGEREKSDALLEEAAAKGALTVRARPDWREAWTTWGRALIGRAVEHFDLKERQRLLRMARQKFTHAAGMGSMEGAFRLARLEAFDGDVPAVIRALEQWRKLEPRAARKWLTDCPDFQGLGSHPGYAEFMESLPE